MGTVVEATSSNFICSWSSISSTIVDSSRTVVVILEVLGKINKNKALVVTILEAVVAVIILVATIVAAVVVLQSSSSYGSNSIS